MLHQTVAMFQLFQLFHLGNALNAIENYNGVTLPHISASILMGRIGGRYPSERRRTELAEDIEARKSYAEFKRGLAEINNENFHASIGVCGCAIRRLGLLCDNPPGVSHQAQQLRHLRVTTGP